VSPKKYVFVRVASRLAGVGVVLDVMYDEDHGGPLNRAEAPLLAGDSH
jgi:hypothetical protein